MIARRAGSPTIPRPHDDSNTPRIIDCIIDDVYVLCPMPEVNSDGRHVTDYVVFDRTCFGLIYPVHHGTGGIRRANIIHQIVEDRGIRAAVVTVHRYAGATIAGRFGRSE